MPSSPNDLPDGVAAEDLYDGPKVVSLPSGRGTFLDPATAPIDPPPQALVAPIPTQVAPTRDVGMDAHVPHSTPQVSTAEVKAAYPAALELAWDVLATRLHFLLALVTACLIWAWVVYDPEIHRVIAAGVFSAVVFWPMALIYWRAGMTGEGG